MAMLGDVYLLVQEEKAEWPVEVSEHPVESGIALTDHVRPKAETLRLSGEIVGEECGKTVEKLRSWQRAGAALHYVGRHLLHSVQMVEFSIEYTNRIAAGCRFEMLLRQLRVASSVFATGLAAQGRMELRYTNGNGIDRVVSLAEERERFHRVEAGETLPYLAGQYRMRGVTAESLREGNWGRDVFRQGHEGDFDSLRPGARLYLGVW